MVNMNFQNTNHPKFAGKLRKKIFLNFQIPRKSNSFIIPSERQRISVKVVGLWSGMICLSWAARYFFHLLFMTLSRSSRDITKCTIFWDNFSIIKNFLISRKGHFWRSCRAEHWKFQQWWPMWCDQTRLSFYFIHDVPKFPGNLET